MDVVARGLAHAFFSGEWTPEGLLQRGATALGSRPSWLRTLCRRVQAHFIERPSEVAPLVLFLTSDARLRARSSQLRIRRWYLDSDEMVAVQGPPARFGMPPIATVGELANRLGVAQEMLPWFADVRRMNAARSEQRLQHYRYRWIKKPRGGVRLLETPKPRLKAIFRAHLSGRIAWIAASNPTRAHKLQQTFARIEWPA